MIDLHIVDEEVNQNWSIIRIAREAPPTTWEHVFENALPELEHISSRLSEQEKLYGKFYPLKKDIFNAFHYTPLHKVKVVILGQDPYPQTINIRGHLLPRAVGLSFSVRPEDKTPVSLTNIYTELYNSIPGFRIPNNGDLREWAVQGVLLLNASLTLIPSSPNSHRSLWLDFISKVFREISVVNPKCIFLLWGNEAQKIKCIIGEKSVILESSHPSGYSVNRGFFGCDHFNIVNRTLIEQGKTPINWQISDRKMV